MNEEIKVTGGLDTGNGYLKASLHGADEPILADMPSVCSIYSLSADIKAEGPAVDQVMNDIFNEMDVTITSEMVRESRRMLFGRRAIKSTMHQITFDVNKFHASKAKQELSAILAIGTVAGAALKSAYIQSKGKLPQKTLQAKAKIVLALPIAEYRAFKEGYSQAFMKGTHLVTFHNFTNPVRVEVQFEDVKVVAEGAAAQFAISNGGIDLDPFVPESLKKEGFTGRDFQYATEVLGIDIGDGTVNFPVFNGTDPGDGRRLIRLSPDASGTMSKGYGTVLDLCLERLKDEGYPHDGRKALAEFLISEPGPMSRRKHEASRHAVEKEAGIFAAEIARDAEKYIGNMNSGLEAIFIYGGGAAVLKKPLERELEASRERFADLKAMFIGPEYARRLNSIGLDMLADAYFGTSYTKDAEGNYIKADIKENK